MKIALVAHANCQVTTQDEGRTCGSRNCQVTAQDEGRTCGSRNCQAGRRFGRARPRSSTWKRTFGCAAATRLLLAPLLGSSQSADSTSTDAPSASANTPFSNRNDKTSSDKIVLCCVCVCFFATAKRVMRKKHNCNTSFVFGFFGFFVFAFPRLFCLVVGLLLFTLLFGC
jgi:hypothetical protein